VIEEKRKACFEVFEFEDGRASAYYKQSGILERLFPCLFFQPE
jgi:hypothetical protein